LLSDLSRIAAGQTKKLHFYALLKWSNAAVNFW
jgi:hypothetical protein